MKRKLNRKSTKRRGLSRRKKQTKRQRGGSNSPTEEKGFIVARCVKKPEHNVLFKDCYTAIRKYHPTVKIVFIDDNSDKSVLEDYPMTNVEVIASEYPGAGEYLPYYYLLTRKLFKKAVLLQDSMILQMEIPFDAVSDYKFLFYYTADKMDQDPMPLIEKSKVPGELTELYNDKSKWCGCWGSTMIITYDFIKQLEDKVGISGWKDIINNRNMRIRLETAIALACTYINNSMPQLTNSLCGDCYDLQVMRDYNEMGKRFDIATYLQDKDKIKDKIIKVFNAR